MSSAINQSQNLGNGFNANATSSRVDVQPGAMKAMWVGDQLVIARAVSIGGRRHVQGAWLDWPAIRSQLLGDVADLLPRAQLVREDALSSDGTSLATLPLRLVSGPVPLPPAQASPLPMTLSLAWAGVLAGALAVGVVMQVALSLGRRREAFVSAVTHELRTPLTTFRLYTDLLAGNMVPQEEKRQAYVLRLADEAQRLSHLVENVLAYSRLSGPQGAAATEAMTLGQLVERCRERMDAWAQRAAMTLVVDGLDAAGGVRVLANPLGVEQILMNLVDNACKYAARSGDRRIHVELATQRGRGVIRIRDHGPGLPQRGLFRPFTKSASAAANSAPGVGLGLALCRRLARGMRGDLCAAPTDSGACLVLTLRLAAKFQTPNAKLQTD